MDTEDKKPLNLDIEMARARRAVENWARRVTQAQARKAQAHGQGEGARAPVSSARAPVRLVELTKPKGGDEGDHRLTPLGYRTARVAFPRVIEDLGDLDRRRMVAIKYADCTERLGSIPVSDVEGAPCTGTVSDGGAVNRVEIADSIRRMHAALAGDAMPVRRDGAGRRSITMRRAIDMVCLRRSEVKDVLKAHGWHGGGKNVKPLSAAILAGLDAMADAMGY